MRRDELRGLHDWTEQRKHPDPLDIGLYLLSIIGISNMLGHESIRGTLTDYLRIPDGAPAHDVVDFIRDVVLDPSNERLLRKWDLGYLRQTLANGQEDVLAELMKDDPTSA